jgi:hypothetical protein
VSKTAHLLACLSDHTNLFNKRGGWQLKYQRQAPKSINSHRRVKEKVYKGHLFREKVATGDLGEATLTMVEWQSARVRHKDSRQLWVLRK